MTAALAGAAKVVIMSRTTRAFTPAGRDAGLRRLRTFNRLLVGAAVAGTGVLTDVAAQGFPGHKRVVRLPAAAQTSPSVQAAVPAHHRHSAGRRHHHTAHRALSAPAHSPTAAATTQQATTQAPQATSPAPQATTPAPQVTVAQLPPAPAPVVSGGS
jgi:hypothetical protein